MNRQNNIAIKHADKPYYHKHLSKEERYAFHLLLNQEQSLLDITQQLKRDVSTLRKEIKRLQFLQEARHAYSLKLHCRLNRVCGDKDCTRPCNLCQIKRCSDYCKHLCPASCERLQKPVYICNGCALERRCRMSKHFDKAMVADAKTKDRRIVSMVHQSLHSFAATLSLVTICKPMKPLHLSGISVLKL